MGMPIDQVVSLWACQKTILFQKTILLSYLPSLYVCSAEVHYSIMKSNCYGYFASSLSMTTNICRNGKTTESPHLVKYYEKIQDYSSLGKSF